MGEQSRARTAALFIVGMLVTGSCVAAMIADAVKRRDEAEMWRGIAAQGEAQRAIYAEQVRQQMAAQAAVQQGQLAQQAAEERVGAPHGRGDEWGRCMRDGGVFAFAQPQTPCPDPAHVPAAQRAERMCINRRGATMRVPLSETCASHGAREYSANDLAPRAPDDDPPSYGGGRVFVRGYYRRNGTYVHSYSRRR